MHMFDAESRMMMDLKDEGRVIAEKQYPLFKVTIVRHPTLGKLVLIEDKNGDGAAVEVEE